MCSLGSSGDISLMMNGNMQCSGGRQVSHLCLLSVGEDSLFVKKKSIL